MMWHGAVVLAAAEAIYSLAWRHWVLDSVFVLFLTVDLVSAAVRFFNCLLSGPGFRVTVMHFRYVQLKR